MKRVICGALVLALVIGAFGCAATSRRDKGIAIGAATGAVLGGLIGKQSDNTAAGAILGAVVGGAAGGVIGHYMDEQAEEMESDLEGAQVERIGEGIKVTFDSGILFDVNKADLRPDAKLELEKLGAILVKYEDTDILLEGHTDSTGADDYNQTLSERRAAAVRAFLVTQGVKGVRMTTVGYGEAQPIADNETPEGRQANRRVEVAIMANEELKAAAENEAAQG
jgi:outer membrane protein OmpA-like peptidoglycan-associated protein